VRTYLAIFDTPTDTTQNKEDEFAGLSEKERKAKLKKQKQKEEKEKEREKKAQEEERNAAATKGKAGVEKKVDPDPEGKTLVSVDVLAEATKLLSTLHRYDPKNIDTNLLAFKVYLRRSIQFFVDFCFILYKKKKKARSKSK
jgi:hypothetical protein